MEHNLITDVWKWNVFIQMRLVVRVKVTALFFFFIILQKENRQKEEDFTSQ